MFTSGQARIQQQLVQSGWLRDAPHGAYDLNQCGMPTLTLVDSDALWHWL